MAIDLVKKEEMVFIELLKNSKISDKELAKKLSTSQPTITRIRNKLFRKRVFARYTVLPSLSTIGLNLTIYTFIRVDYTARKKISEWIKGNPLVVFASEGEGMDENIVVTTIHPSFDDYANFLNELRNKFGKEIATIRNFTISNKTTIKDFNLDEPIELFLTKTVKEMQNNRRGKIKA